MSVQTDSTKLLDSQWGIHAKQLSLDIRACRHCWSCSSLLIANRGKHSKLYSRGATYLKSSCIASITLTATHRFCWDVLNHTNLQHTNHRCKTADYIFLKCIRHWVWSAVCESDHGWCSETFSLSTNLPITMNHHAAAFRVVWNTWPCYLTSLRPGSSVPACSVGSTDKWSRSCSWTYLNICIVAVVHHDNNGMFMASKILQTQI